MPESTPQQDDLSRNLVLVFKKLKSMRMQRVRRHPELEISAFPVLYSLIGTEPQRISALAEAIHSDVSTVSRQVGRLEAMGLIERTADPDDGRAAVLSLTGKGRRIICEEQQDHAEWISGLLADWSEDDLNSFNEHLTRLQHSLAAVDHHVTNTNHKKGEHA